MKQENIAKIGSNSFESSFYTLISVLAYSKFVDTIDKFENKSDSDKKTNEKQIENAEFYRSFVKYEDEFSKKFDKKLYQNIILIIDELCLEKIREFFIIIENPNLNNSKKFAEFYQSNNQNVESICIRYEKNIINKLKKERVSNEEMMKLIEEMEKKVPYYEYIENLFKELKEENPQKLQELIDFEISKKELKESCNKVKLILDGEIAPLSTVFLTDAKESIKSKKVEKLEKKSSCTIL